MTQKQVQGQEIGRDLERTGSEIKYFVRVEGTNKDNMAVVKQTINGRSYSSGDRLMDHLVESTLEQARDLAFYSNFYLRTNWKDPLVLEGKLSKL